MKLRILNKEHGIFVINGIEDVGHIQMEKIKEQIPESAEINDLAFFYMPDRDWIVLNKAHKRYWFYSEIIPVYLKLSAKNRKECMAQAPSNTVRNALGILEDVIARSQLIDSLFFKKGGVEV